MLAHGGSVKILSHAVIKTTFHLKVSFLIMGIKDSAYTIFKDQPGTVTKNATVAKASGPG